MLSDAQWGLVHDLGLELLQVRQPEEQIRCGLLSLLRLVDADVAADVDADLRHGCVRVVEVPDLLMPMAGAGADVILQSNPGIAHVVRHGRLEVSRVEDLATPQEWAGNPMRRELLDPAGVPHALLTAYAVGGPQRPGLQGWGLNRSRPFTDVEVELFQAYEPFLRHAARQRVREELVVHLDHAVTSGAGLVIFGPDSVLHRNAEAGALLERHRVGLPTLRAWCRRLVEEGRESGAMPSEVGVLRLRRRPALPDCVAVVIDEATTFDDAPGGLTPRQFAALGQLAAGATAAAIGRQLGISERTVHKHLEHLYRALGVGDRLAAVLKAHDLGLLPTLATVAGGRGGSEVDNGARPGS